MLLSGRLLPLSNQRQPPDCPAVVSRDHAVYLAAEHAEGRGSLRSHELVDNAEGAVFRFFYRTQHGSRSHFKIDLASDSLQFAILA